MKGVLLIAALTIASFTQTATAQTGKPEALKDLTKIDEIPKFPGRVTQYLIDNIHYPDDAFNKKIEGKVFTKFVISSTGEVTDVEVVKGLHPSLDAEAIRVLSAMPKWRPGTLQGKPVDVQLSLPISFSLAEAAKKQPAAQSKSDAHAPMIYSKADQMPAFEGGVMSYLVKNIRYPEDAKKKKIEGEVVLRFVIDDKGNVGDVKVAKAAHPSLDAEAVRVIRSMPKWNPGKQNGKPVSVYFTQPILFRL